MRHLASVALWALTAFGIILVAASALGSGDQQSLALVLLTRPTPFEHNGAGDFVSKGPQSR